MNKPLNWIRTSVSHQLFTGFALVAVLFSVAAVLALEGIHSVASTGRTGEANALAAETLRMDVFRMEAAQQSRVINHGVLASDHVDDLVNFQRDVNALRTKLGAPYAADFTQIHDRFATWLSLVQRAGALARHNETAAGKLATGAADNATDDLTNLLGSLATTLQNRTNASFASSENSATLTVLLLAALALLIAIVTAVVLSRRIAGNTREVLRAAEAVSVGDVEQTISVTSQDEIGQMADAFRNVVGYLREITGSARQIAEGDFTVQIQPHSDRDALSHAFIEMRDRVSSMVSAIAHTSETLAASSQQMASTSDEVGRAIGEIAESVGSVAEGAEQQVRSVEDARRLSEEVAVASQSSAENARETANAAQQARSVADEGSEAVKHASEAMRAVADSSEQAARAIRELGAKSEKIGGIVDTITGIAEQTNLLALNAAIEAARAGEQGRGFAVVAEEVRKLAEESRRAAATIADLIGEIQGETGKAVEVVELGARQTETGVNTVELAREAFQQIGLSVHDMTGRIEEIVSAVAQIAENSERVQEAVSAVASVAEQSSAATEQVSAATEQTSASTEQTAASAQELANTAEELGRLVGQFTLAEAHDHLVGGSFGSE